MNGELRVFGHGKGTDEFIARGARVTERHLHKGGTLFSMRGLYIKDNRLETASKHYE